MLISDSDGETWYIENSTGSLPVDIEFGGEPITLTKGYGPLVAYTLKVFLDKEKAEWVIQREGDEEAEWIEVVRFRCQ